MNLRLRIVQLGFVIAFVFLIVRLFYWQVIKAKDLSDQARRQYQSSQTISAPRGKILSSDKSYLAGRGDGWLVYAQLPDIKLGVSEIADKLAPILVDDDEAVGETGKQTLFDEANRLKELLGRKGAVWVVLKHKVGSEKKQNIEALKIGGIGFDKEEVRNYPEASTAAHLLGFVGKDEEGADKGYFGLEGYYDQVLTGKPGLVLRDQDAKGAPIALGDQKEISSQSGVNLLTHVDKGLQINLEYKLKEGIEKYGAKGGSAVVMDPKTGAILAMSSFPSFDPLKYSEYSNDLFRNPVVSDAFEPGSIFKVLVMSAGLDAKAVEPDTKCDICSGPLKVDKYSIETWNNEYFPDSTMADVIKHSDNVGMAFVGQKLGADSLYDYLSKFGIGKTTGIDLQGEVSPQLRKKGTWNIVDLSTASFGQGVAVTPIQMLRAVGAIANKGVLVTPQVVDKLLGDSWDEDIKPQIGERIISEDTADKITTMMAEAAKNGESKWTYLRGFRVAGKTGTAQIPIAGHYDAEKTIASFVGFAPAEDPKFVMLVTIREPQSSTWASETAAPLWYNIAKDLFIYFGVQPE